MTDVYATADGGTPADGEISLTGEIGALLLVVLQQLRDITGQTWLPSILLPYVNKVLLEIVTLKPDAYPVEAVMQLVAGARQAIVSTTMSTVISLIDVICNMGTTGTVVGMTIRALEKNAMDHLLPGWMTYAADQTVLHVIKDDRNPLVFYVFPPQPTTAPNQIKLLLSEPPDDITATNTDFPFDPSYKIAFIDGMIYHCLMEETTAQGANQKAVGYYNKFLQGLGLMSNVDKQTNEKSK